MKQLASNTIEVKRGGNTVLIRKVVKDDKAYYVVNFYVNGKRKQVWRTTMESAKSEANLALDKIAAGETAALDLTASDRNFYLRASEVLKFTGKPLDIAAIEYAEAFKLLGGKISIVEACREWTMRNAVSLPKISVAEAVKQICEGKAGDKKSADYLRVLAVQLKGFAAGFNCTVDAVTPSMISKFLTGLPVGERTKRNYRDAIRHANNWLILHRFLPKGADWMEGVQKYSKRKHGEVTIYSPEEMQKILTQAQIENGWRPPMLAINAFSAMRHAEICRLNWEDIELSDKPGESFIEVRPIDNTKSEGRRRLVPISDNLKAWLELYRAKSGPVVPVSYRDSMKFLPPLVVKAGVKFKRNAFRHSGISYRIAQTGDIARIADESGNSVEVIRSNYLRRVKPAQAEEWFSLLPDKKIIAKPSKKKVPAPAGRLKEDEQPAAPPTGSITAQEN